MIPFQKEKIGNAVALFARAHARRSGSCPRQTWLYNALALLDFRFLKRYGVPSLGLEYDAVEMGAVPVDLYDERFGLEGVYFRFVPAGAGCLEVRENVEPDLDYFSDAELDIVEDIAATYADAPPDKLIDDLRRELRAWRVAREQAVEAGKKRIAMDFRDEFDPAIFGKKESQLSPAEARFLCYLDTRGCRRLTA
ncbi:MAG: SocA family protein [Synergistales bacterium]|nr:SocA family protein [Synergistales bacterium]